MKVVKKLHSISSGSYFCCGNIWIFSCLLCFFFWLEVLTQLFSAISKQRDVKIDFGGASVKLTHFFNWVTKTKTIVERTFQILTLMNFHELMEIKSNFQRPSSSESTFLSCKAVKLPNNTKCQLPVAKLLTYNYGANT